MTVQSAILARVSDDKNGRSKSVPEQIDAGRAVCAVLGWHVAAEHDDQDVSASRFARNGHRPGWAALKEGVASGAYEAVVLWDPSRASRDLPDWAGFLALCRQRGVLIYVIKYCRAYDLSVNHDWEVLATAGVRAAADSDQKSEDIRRGLNGAMARGEPVTRASYGYRKTHGSSGNVSGMVIVPAEAEVVRRMFGLLAAGESLSATARLTGLTRQNIRSRSTNPAYIAQRRLADGSYVACQWEPIVDADVFWRVQDILRTHLDAGRKPGSYRSLLSHLATCGVCGGEITIERHRDRYRCRLGHVTFKPVDEADLIVEFALAELVEQPGVLERYTAADGAEAASARAEAAQLRQRLDDLAASYASGRVTIAALERAERDLRPALEAAEDRARKAAIPAALAPFMTMERAGQAWNVVQEMPLGAIREAIRELCRVEIHKGHKVEVLPLE